MASWATFWDLKEVGICDELQNKAAVLFLTNATFNHVPTSIGLFFVPKWKTETNKGREGSHTKKDDHLNYLSHHQENVSTN